MSPEKSTNPPDGIVAVFADNNDGGDNDVSQDKHSEEISMADWRVLKAAPGRANAKNLLTEINRLKLCRQFALPAEICIGRAAQNSARFASSRRHRRTV